MLIRFIPALPMQSTIVFSLSFTQHNVPTPLAIAQQIGQLLEDGLDLPQDWHVLDKSTVQCRMIDGVVVDWSLPQGCSDMLELVLSDVNDATLADREKHRLALEQVTDNDKPALSLNSLKNRHKKQRSLVNDACNTVHVGDSCSIADINVVPALPHAVQLTARGLRQRARSTLVNAFRIYALPELRHRIPRSGYYPWIIESTLRHASRKLEELADNMLLSPLTSSFNAYSEDDQTDWSDYDTDSSSLHTPSTYHSINHSDPYPNPFEIEDKHRSRQPPMQAQYTVYSELTYRLEQLLHLHRVQERHREREEEDALALLEVRSKRRAWLNKQLSSSRQEWGLASPFRSSPLANDPWTFEDIKSAERGKDNEMSAVLQEVAPEIDSLFHVLNFHPHPPSPSDSCETPTPTIFVSSLASPKVLFPASVVRDDSRQDLNLATASSAAFPSFPITTVGVIDCH
ncbi:hypothetical protein DL96DRAFT_1703420 [Flagelloscypha sp. PMI_526]|nr:hypothetical protein DL96DRAFT_1703420 [Flagelloscypha sp. PMI_526]